MVLVTHQERHGHFNVRHCRAKTHVARGRGGVAPTHGSLQTTLCHRLSVNADFAFDIAGGSHTTIAKTCEAAEGSESLSPRLHSRCRAGVALRRHVDQGVVSETFNFVKEPPRTKITVGVRELVRQVVGKLALKVPEIVVPRTSGHVTRVHCSCKSNGFACVVGGSKLDRIKEARTGRRH